MSFFSRAAVAVKPGMPRLGRVAVMCVFLLFSGSQACSYNKTLGECTGTCPSGTGPTCAPASCPPPQFPCCGCAMPGILGVLGVVGVEAAFKEFRSNFVKEYANAVEEASRFAAFTAYYNFILSENAKSHSYTLGINRFADMTSAEVLAAHTEPTPRNIWGDLPFLGWHEVSDATLPSVDWRAKGAVTPVKNQGQAAASWTFSATGSVEGAWEIKTGKLVSLSEQQLADCANDMSMWPQYAETHGLCTEGSYNNGANSASCHDKNCTVAVPKGAITGYKAVTPNDEQALMDAVAQQPVSVLIEADQMVFMSYTGGVLAGPCGTQVNHAALIVGYGTSSGQDYWLVKNSWGVSWGESGYVMIARGKSGAGECGIKSQASYPVVQKISEDIIV